MIWFFRGLTARARPRHRLPWCFSPWSRAIRLTQLACATPGAGTSASCSGA